VSPVELTDGREREGVYEEPDHISMSIDQAWPTINQSILSAAITLNPPFSSLVTGVASSPPWLAAEEPLLGEEV
jgi:hypothetical protein